jgi:hypothetical protein
MGTLDDGNSGPFDDLPELPPGWGPIRIPDDPSELAEEAAQVRRELRERPRAARPADGTAAAGAARPGRGRHATEIRRHPAAPAAEPPSLRLPLLIVTAALIAAVASLFAVAWSGARRQPVVEETAQTTATPTARTVPALDLLDETGRPVSLRGLLPAAIVLTDACVCERELRAVADAAPPGVTVIGLNGEGQAAATSSAAQPAPRPVRRLRDPGGELRRFLGTAPTPDHAPLLVVEGTGEVLGEHDATAPTTAYAADLATLATT